MIFNVVIPCARPEYANFDRIFSLTVPKGVSVEYFVIIDRPEFVTAKINHFISDNIHFIQNKENVGSAASRNTGLDLSKGDYVLFLDDDVLPEEDLLVKYHEAVKLNPECPGLVGLTEFPAPVNSFTAGVKSSDVLTFFNIAETRKRVAWGTTSNLMIKRDSIGQTKFDLSFPKSGGGEDIAFCLKIQAGNENKFITVPGAAVRHDWWNGGKRHYNRFFRWAYGDCVLPSSFPEYRYRNFPNFVETVSAGSLFLLIAVYIGILSPWSVALFVFLSLISDIFSEILRVRRLRPVTNLRVATEGALIRLANDLGRMTGNLLNGRILSIGERFDYFTTRESIPFERRIGCVKFCFFLFSFLVSTLLIYYL